MLQTDPKNLRVEFRTFKKILSVEISNGLIYWESFGGKFDVSVWVCRRG